MNTKIILVALALCVMAGARAKAADYRSMQCTILGCTDGEIKMQEWAGEWVFELYEKFYLTNPLLDEMSAFLRQTNRIGVHDRVDYLRFELDKHSCVEERAVGSFLCKGKANPAYARVRQNERYIDATDGYDFTWSAVTPTDDRPWTVELRKIASAGSIEWLMTISDGSESREFRAAPLYHCRYNEPTRSAYRMRSCQVKGNQGSGQMGLTTFEGGDHVYLDVKEDGRGYLPIAFTRAFADLGYIGPFDLVSALTYSPRSKNCTFDSTLRGITCQENAAQIRLTVARTDNNGVTHQRDLAVEVDGASFDLAAKKGAGSWEWGLQKDGKRARIDSLEAYDCLYGDGGDRTSR